MQTVEDRLLAATSRVARADPGAWAAYVAVFRELTIGSYSNTVSCNGTDGELRAFQGVARAYTKLLELAVKAGEPKKGGDNAHGNRSRPEAGATAAG